MTESEVSNTEQQVRPSLVAEQVGVALFSRHFAVVDVEQAWNQSGIPLALESLEKRARENVKRAVAVDGKVQLQFTVGPQRADLILGPSAFQPEPGEPQPRVVGIANYAELLARLQSYATALLAVLPPMVRIGINGGFLKDFQSREECVAFLQTRLPGLDLDPQTSDDILVQVNRRIKPGADDLILNRLVSWQSIHAQTAFIPVLDAMAAAATSSLWIARCGIDVNNPITTVSDAAKEYEGAQAQNLFSVLFQRFEESVNHASAV